VTVVVAFLAFVMLLSPLLYVFTSPHFHSTPL
jgi:hypothetical protein